MKKFFISIMSLILGVSGYAVVEKTIEERVGLLESQVSELQYEVSSLKTPIAEVTTGKDVTELTTEKVTKPDAPTTNSEILYAYNQAVVKTNKNSPTGQSTMKLAGSITSDGAIGSIAEVLSPIAEAALARNSTPTNFIPGYGELKGEDLKSIKVTDNGKTYIVEMTVKSQTDGSDADSKSGPVGRAIGTLGNIDGALKELGAEIKSGRETVSLTYDDVSVRAEIDKASGLIVHGQWHYVVKVCVGDAEASINILTANLKNLKANIDYTVII